MLKCNLKAYVSQWGSPDSSVTEMRPATLFHNKAYTKSISESVTETREMSVITQEGKAPELQVCNWRVVGVNSRWEKMQSDTETLSHVATADAAFVPL